jgi:hypothetical protein
MAMTMALEDGGSVAAFGRWNWAVVEDYSSSVGQRRRQKNMQQWHWCQHCQSRGLTIKTLASASARTAREDTSDMRDVHWQQWQGDRGIAAAVVVAAVQIR